MINKGLFQRLVLAAILAVGFLCVWGVAGIWGLEICRSIVLGHEELIIVGQEESEEVAFRSDGTPLIVRGKGRGKRQYRNLAGVAVTPPVDDPGAWINGTQLPASLPSRLGNGDVSWEDRIRSFSDGRTPAVRWHFVSDGRPEGKAYFVGYDSHSKACVGYLGMAGFRAEMPSAEERFPFSGVLSGSGSRVFCPELNNSARRKPDGDLAANRREVTPDGALSPWMVYVFGRDQKLYEADLRQRTVRIVLDERRLRSVALVRDSRNRTQASFHQLAARTDDSVIVLDERGRELRRYPIPETLDGKTFTFAETSAGEALMFWNSPEDMLTTEVEHRICWASPNGRIREADLTLPYADPMRSLRELIAAVVPSPLVLDVVLTMTKSLRQELREDGRAESLPETVRLTLIDFWPAIVSAQLFAAALALLCYRRQVRYGTSRRERVVWPLFVLLLGLPGWIGYRFGRSWPVLESCPDCGVAVPRDREGCARCANDFPTPALKGTEVFA
jgi:hypothetical protein